MIDIEKELRKARKTQETATLALAAAVDRHPLDVRKEREALIAVRARLALLCDLRDVGLGRFPEPPGKDDPLAVHCVSRTNFARSMVITVTERLEDGSHDWEAVVRMPDGRMLTSSLSDDAPQTPGAAVISAGHALDSELAEERWNELWVRAGRRDDVARIREAIEHEIPASLVELFDDLVR